MLGFISILPSLVHVQYVMVEVTHSPLLRQGAEYVYICQIQGNASVISNSGQVRMGPSVIPEKHSLLLPQKIFMRHTIHITPHHTHQSNCVVC